MYHAHYSKCPLLNSMKIVRDLKKRRKVRMNSIESETLFVSPAIMYRILWELKAVWEEVTGFNGRKIYDNIDLPTEAQAIL